MAALIAQSPSVQNSDLPNPPRANRTWTETSVADFRDGWLDPSMYVSRRAGLDPDSGTVEFFSRFDVNNDGWLDLVCSDDSGPYLRLFFGSAAGYDSTRSRYYPVPGGGNSDLADLNLDGYAELIHSGWRTGYVVIYWGTDSGPSLTDTTRLAIAGSSEAVAVCDLDRDSYLDILAGSDNGNLYIFWGSAAGYSGASRSSVFLNGSVGHNIEIADFDRDGYTDVALSLWSRDRNPVIYWGAGRTPRTIAWLQVLPDNPHGISVADLDMNGWLDIVYTGYDQVTAAYIYYGGPSGFSVANRETVNPGKCYGGSTAVLWNADKTLDLVFFRGEWGVDTTFRPRVFFNRADTFPHFSNARSSDIGDSLFNASGGLVADLNRDGYLDVFVNNMRPNNYSRVLWGPDYGQTTPLPVHRDHHGIWREMGNIYTRSFDANYLSSVFDIGPDSAITGGTCSWVADEPGGSEVMMLVRSGSTPVPDQTWSPFYPVPFNGGELPDVVIDNRYIQYRVVFCYLSPSYLPRLERVAFDLTADLAVDVAVSRILVPAGTVDSGVAVIPRVVVTNNEPSSPAVTVNLRIGPGYSRTVVDTIAPHSSDTILFPAWTPTVLGRFTVRCSVYAAHDRVPANDTLSDTVRVRAHEDVGPL
ncbi:VCBS repeat-containing protein, partial [candidate division WOR-3 bacterium]|nr:VCBS repeat-containing protein [candidate division WOR-3 bacterium]